MTYVWAILLLFIVTQGTAALLMTYRQTEFTWGDLAVIILFCGPLVPFTILVTHYVAP